MGGDLLVVGGSGFGKRRAIRRLYSTTFEMAQKDVALAVPYFVPLADWVCEGLYFSLMNAGVKVREYTGSVLHVQSMVVHDRLAVVGERQF